MRFTPLRRLLPKEPTAMRFATIFSFVQAVINDDPNDHSPWENASGRPSSRRLPSAFFQDANYHDQIVKGRTRLDAKNRPESRNSVDPNRMREPNPSENRGRPQSRKNCSGRPLGGQVAGNSRFIVSANPSAQGV
jgi:hypothetical protein